MKLSQQIALNKRRYAAKLRRQAELKRAEREKHQKKVALTKLRLGLAAQSGMFE